MQLGKLRVILLGLGQHLFGSTHALSDERRLDFAYVGAEAGLTLVVGTEEAPAKPDPNPEPLTIPHTARDLISRPVPRRILAAGEGRW